MPPKRFDIFPPDWEMPRRSGCFLIFLLRTLVFTFCKLEPTKTLLVLLLSVSLILHGTNRIVIQQCRYVQVSRVKIW